MKLSKRQKRQVAKSPRWLATVAITITHKPRLKFSRGAASPVRHLIADGKPAPVEPERLAG
jgi:hypothetical protein